MNIVEKTFLNLISSALNGKKNDNNIKIDESMYNSLEELAVVNRCLPLVYQGCIHNGIEPPVHWKHSVAFFIIDSHRKLTIENEIMNILESNKVRACVLKGSSVAMNYPNPLARSMGDIDILVDEYNYEKAALLFVEYTDFISNRHDFHFSFNYKNVVIELHKQVTRYSKEDRYYYIFNNCMDNIRIRKCDEFEVPTLSDKHQAISLLTHMIRHFSENKFVFRMYCDWVCFVNNISSVSWEREIYPYIEEAGLSLFANALNQSAIMFLGFDMQSKVVNNVDYETCNILIEEFFCADKSDSTDGIDVNLGTLFSHQGFGRNNIFSTYISSVNYIVKHKYYLGKCVFLRPIFWIWLPVKYCFNVIVGRRKKLNFKRIDKIVNRRKMLYQNLKLTRDNDFDIMQ